MTAPRSYDELLRRAPDAARALTGAEKSNWNDTVRPVNRRRVLGIADRDGTMYLDESKVAGPLREMFETPGAQHDDETLERYSTALKTLLHEHVHLQGTEGSRAADSYRNLSRRGTRELEEGATEAWSHATVGRFAEELELDEIAPGISDARIDATYPEYTPAAQKLAAAVGAEAGLEQNDVLRRMSAVSADQKWELAADLMYDARGLGEVIPPGREAEVKSNIVRAMQNTMDLEHLKDYPDDTARTASAQVGTNAYRAGAREADMYAEMYQARGLSPERRQAAQQWRGDGRITPPSAGRPPGAGPGSLLDSAPAAGQLPGDARHAVHLLNNGSPPLSSARPLNTAEFGARGSEPHSQPLQRQSPDRGR